jgi:hypothetical protein
MTSGSGRPCSLCKALQDNKTLVRIDISHNNLLTALRRPENRQVYLALRKERIVGVAQT